MRAWSPFKSGKICGVGDHCFVLYRYITPEIPLLAVDTYTSRALSVVGMRQENSSHLGVDRGLQAVKQSAENSIAQSSFGGLTETSEDS